MGPAVGKLGPRKIPEHFLGSSLLFWWDQFSARRWTPQKRGHRIQRAEQSEARAAPLDISDILVVGDSKRAQSTL